MLGKAIASASKLLGTGHRPVHRWLHNRVGWKVLGKIQRAVTHKRVNAYAI